MSKYKILVADDHAMIRSGLRLLLTENNDLEVAGEASTGEEAIEQHLSLRPDLIILDISMPDMNGMDVAREMLANDPDARIIILSMYSDEEYIARCMEYGVKGYVIKSETSDELAYAVDMVLRGRTYFSSQVQKVIFKKYTDDVIRKTKKEPEISLTSREIEIVKLIACGLTSQQIADKLFISSRTVENHRANLMKKVNVRNAIELVQKIKKLDILSE